jgi:hypothetical protein
MPSNFLDSGKRMGYFKAISKKGKGKAKASAADIQELSYRPVREMLRRMAEEGFMTGVEVARILTKESWLADWVDANQGIAMGNSERLKEVLAELVTLWRHSLT